VVPFSGHGVGLHDVAYNIAGVQFSVLATKMYKNILYRHTICCCMRSRVSNCRGSLSSAQLTPNSTTLSRS